MKNRSLTQNMGAKLRRYGAPISAVEQFEELHLEASLLSRQAMAVYREWVPKSPKLPSPAKKRGQR